MNKFDKFILIATIFILGVAYIIATLKPESPQYLYDQNIALRKQHSMTVFPVFKSEKQFSAVQPHGSSTIIHVGKFECCGTLGQVVLNGGVTTVNLGYLNTTEATPIGTTTKTQIPVIDMEVLGHELVHVVLLQPYVTQRCPALLEPSLQEDIAYNWGHLYTQVKSMDEDNFLRIVK